MIKKSLIIFRHIFYNLYSFFAGLVLKRCMNCVVLGAWGGKKFADNSRFLFQFLSQYKSNLGLNHVIWATRDEEINKTLKIMGYESCLIGTKESKKWHLKSGIHIICNMREGSGKFQADIDTRYSFGAKKIQLWHGVGMKAIGKVSNKEKSIGKGRRLLSNKFIKTMISEGGWYNEFFLCTSELNKHMNYITSSGIYDRFFISSYPRNCECLAYTDNEIRIIDIIKQYSGCIIYLPTFRGDVSSYIHPLIDERIVSFVEENNYLWIEKPHSADIHSANQDVSSNVLYLQSDFDINVLYKYVGLVVSDYSSASFDAVFKNIPLIMYAPDLDYFKNNDVGFLFDLREYLPSLLYEDLDKVIEGMISFKDGKYFTKEHTDVYMKIRKDYFDNRIPNYLAIWNDIKNAINKEK